MEQVLLGQHGLGKEGGTLLNKINSISSNNSIYTDAIKRGNDIIKTIEK